jgi:hypothetical protein
MDWSLEELKSALRCAIEWPRRSVCIFIDGLDEIDQKQGGSRYYWI